MHASQMSHKVQTGRISLYEYLFLFCVLLQMENFCTELAIFFSIKLYVAGFKKIYNNEQDEFHVDSTNLIEQACKPPVRGRKQISCDTDCSCQTKSD